MRRPVRPSLLRRSTLQCISEESIDNEEESGIQFGKVPSHLQKLALMNRVGKLEHIEPLKNPERKDLNPYRRSIPLSAHGNLNVSDLSKKSNFTLQRNSRKELNSDNYNKKKRRNTISTAWNNGFGNQKAKNLMTQASALVRNSGGFARRHSTMASFQHIDRAHQLNKLNITAISLQNKSPGNANKLGKSSTALSSKIPGYMRPTQAALGRKRTKKVTSTAHQKR